MDGAGRGNRVQASFALAEKDHDTRHQGPEERSGSFGDWVVVWEGSVRLVERAGVRRDA